ncbi:MAG: AP endonuclease [Clostridia bacterium]|nr:AP endonuclease [Clostridia bacterium]
MKIRNIEVEFDFLDADDMEKFENEAKKVVEQCKIKEKQQMSYSQMIREQCKIINDFFNNVFGDGMSQKLFGNKDNLKEHISAFEEIVKEKENQQKSIVSSLERYQPNRETRRNKRK